MDQVTEAPGSWLEDIGPPLVRAWLRGVITLGALGFYLGLAAVPAVLIADLLEAWRGWDSEAVFWAAAAMLGPLGVGSTLKRNPWAAA